MTITIEDIRQAQKRLSGNFQPTPLLENPFLNKRVGGRVLVKAESLQSVGAFKIRGAFNRLSQLNESEREKGVVAFSSGNHAQGIAYAAQLLGIPATIVMPEDAPQIKIERTLAYGAEVRLYNRHTESREAIAGEIAADQGSVLVPSYDDPDIIAGQGTCGLEITEQFDVLGLEPKMLLSPCGGGGLIAGVSTAVKSRFPDIRVYAVEPESFDDHFRSLQSGDRETVTKDAHSFCDALLAPTPGKLTWEINRHNLYGGLLVSDDEVAHAISFAFQYLKLVAEPGGAVALAAVLQNKTDLRDKISCIIVSGGNIDSKLFCQCLQKFPQP